MKSAQLTPAVKRLSIAAMAGKATRVRRGLLALPVLGLVTGLGGCINLKAPDKPIVIELNINIKQEVVYRLAKDASNTIADNPDIF